MKENFTLDKEQKKLILKLIETMDNLERGIRGARKDVDIKEVENVVGGMEMIIKNTRNSLAQEGVEVIDPLDEHFDPYVHEGVGIVEDPSVPSNTVVRVELKGYKKGKLLIRPAMVHVSKGGPKRSKDGGPEPKPLGKKDLKKRIPGYEIIEPIGRGNLGEVFVAEKKVKKKSKKKAKGPNRVALKITHPHISKGEGRDLEKAILKEAKNWKMLCSKKKLKKNLVPILTFDIEPEPYIEMSYMKEGSLEDRMDDMDIEEKMHCLSEVLSTLFEAHNYGIVHGAVKPSNIFYDKQGRWRISDWGAGRIKFEPLKRSDTSEGARSTLTYSAPEQLITEDPEEIDRQTDIFQAGVLAYRLLTGSAPFDGDGVQLMNSIMNDDPKHPSDLEETIPRNVGDAVMGALSKEKEDRWKTAFDLKEALEERDQSVPEEERNMGIYSNALKQAVVDGIMSADEKKMLEDLRGTLGISLEDHERLIEQGGYEFREVDGFRDPDLEELERELDVIEEAEIEEKTKEPETGPDISPQHIEETVAEEPEEPPTQIEEPVVEEPEPEPEAPPQPVEEPVVEEPEPEAPPQPVEEPVVEEPEPEAPPQPVKEPVVEERPVVPDEKLTPSMDSIYGKSDVEPAKQEPKPQNAVEPEPVSTPAPEPQPRTEPETVSRPEPVRDIPSPIREPIVEKMVRTETTVDRVGGIQPEPKRNTAVKEVEPEKEPAAESDIGSITEKKETLSSEPPRETEEPERRVRRPPTRAPPTRQRRRSIIERKKEGSTESLEERMSSVRSSLKDELSSIRKKKKKKL